MPKSAGITLCLVQMRNDLQLGMIHFFNDHLGDSVSPTKGVGLASQIYHSDHYFAPIIRVDSTGRVNQANSVLGGQPAAGSDLGFKTGWKCNGKTGGYQGKRGFFKDDIVFNGCTDIHSRRLRRHVARQRDISVFFRVESHNFYNRVRIQEQPLQILDFGFWIKKNNETPDTKHETPNTNSMIQNVFEDLLFLDRAQHG